MYVKWNSTKYHALGKSGYRVTTHQDGKKQVNGILYGSEVLSARTSCGIEISAENECFNSLPEGAGSHNDVCYKCDVGVGALKIDHIAEQAKINEQSKASFDKVLNIINASARKVFDSL